MINNYVSRCSIGLILLATPSLWVSAAAGQTISSPSQTPQGEEVRRQSPDAELSIRVGGSLAAPEGAETVQITIESAVLDGGFDPLAGQTAKLLPQPGAQISLADLYRIAGEVQQAYLDAGYPLVRVFVPVQDLDRSNARIKLTVVSGYVGKVDVEALDPRVKKIVARYFNRLIKREPLTAAQLERAVLLAGDVSGVTLASALSPGTQTGETVLIASGTFSPVQGVLSVDNRLSRELGREQVTASFAFNSVLGLGERIGATYATAIDDVSFSRTELRRYAGLYLDLPVGNDGLVVGVDAAASTSRPRGFASFLALSNRFVRAGGRVAYPLIRSRTSRLVATTSFDLNRETQESLLLGFPVPLYRDQTRVVRFGFNASTQPETGLFASTSVEYSKGLNILDARSARDATIFEPLSRIGADAEFDKLTGDFLVEGAAPEIPLVGRINLRAQTGFDKPLLRSEQLSVVSPDLISGPPTGSLVGDSGYGVRYQIESTLPAGNLNIVPYGFAAAARAVLERPTAFELRRTDIKAYGAGIRTSIALVAGTIISGQLEYSHTVSDDRNLGGDWVTFGISLRF